MKTHVILLIAALILLSSFGTAFALINYSNSVKVWPLMSFHPLTLVIGVSIALGMGVGGLLGSLLQQQRVLRASKDEPDTLSADLPLAKPALKRSTISERAQIVTSTH